MPIDLSLEDIITLIALLDATADDNSQTEDDELAALLDDLHRIREEINGQLPPEAQQ